MARAIARARARSSGKRKSPRSARLHAHADSLAAIDLCSSPGASGSSGSSSRQASGELEEGADPWALVQQQQQAVPAAPAAGGLGTDSFAAAVMGRMRSPGNPRRQA